MLGSLAGVKKGAEARNERPKVEEVEGAVTFQCSKSLSERCYDTTTILDYRYLQLVEPTGLSPCMAIPFWVVVRLCVSSGRLAGLSSA